jgi:trimethylamine:corrinoid methyltransferase-like protein
MDMKLGTLASGSMKLSLLNAVSAQLSRYYGLGNVIWGPNSDSKIYDETGFFRYVYEKETEVLDSAKNYMQAGPLAASVQSDRRRNF